MIDQNIKKVLLLGSGALKIGEAGEFDYSGSQALKALKEEGIETVLINPNIATVQTSEGVADRIYFLPVTPYFIERVIEKERPQGIMLAFGGQTALNCGVELYRSGVLEKYNLQVLGTPVQAIMDTEDRELFVKKLDEIDVKTIKSEAVETLEDARRAAKTLGYPVIIRAAYALGGLGSGFCDNEAELDKLAEKAFSFSPQVLVEKSLKGWKEVEYEVVRDRFDNCITVCNMENFDPLGIHTGESIVIAPSQTLTNSEYHKLRELAIRIVRHVGIVGECNVQYAFDPESEDYRVIEVNARLSRSSALASKATGYPLAFVAAKLGLGYGLFDLKNSVTKTTSAFFEPALDYIVTKIPRFPFDKFSEASNTLGTQMKATGEVMSIGRTMGESLLKAVRGLETGVCHIWHKKFDDKDNDYLINYIRQATDDRLYAIAQLIRNGVDLGMIYNATKIDMFFLEKIKNIVEFEAVVKANPMDEDTLIQAKEMGFSDKYIAVCWSVEGKSYDEADIFRLRKEKSIMPVYKMIDTCASEFSAYIPYFYSTYEQENESIVSDRKKIVVLGSGPIRIGQGIEFDYSTVHAIWTIQQAGYEAIVINNNPETVSTDYATSDKLYFEPLTVEDVMNIIDLEKPDGVIVTLGGQTAINLAEPLHKLGVKIIGTDVEAIDRAENRDSFEKVMNTLGIPQPKGLAVTNIPDGCRVAQDIGYPVLVRPSFVLGGRAMKIVNNEESLKKYLQTAVEINVNQPVLVDKYISGKELEVDAICDGRDVFIPGIMEHVERTGIHSGDSISVYPTFPVSQKVKDKIIDYSVRLGLEIGIIGLFNIQFIADTNDDVFVIEVNPRSSRTVPFLSKATGVDMSDIATRVQLGHSLAEQGIDRVYHEEKKSWFVKAPAFSFSKIRGMDAYLSPEMKSTGEAIGYDKSLTRALYKALRSSGMNVANYGTILVTIADCDKQRALPLVKRFYDMGFNIEATKGTAKFLKDNGIRTRERRKISEGSEEIFDSLRQGHVSYVINTIDINKNMTTEDGFQIRRCAVENNVAMFTSLETVKVLLDVLEEITLGVSTIDKME